MGRLDKRRLLAYEAPMIVDTVQELAGTVGRGRRLMGLDVGSKTIGLALSDPSLTVATPMDTIRRRKFTRDARELIGIFEQQSVGGLVIGLPVSMDGTEGPACQSVRQFGANLSAKTDLPMTFWDERLSTSAVERLLTDEADLSRGRRAELVDKMAAAYILQGALDSLTGAGLP